MYAKKYILSIHWLMNQGNKVNRYQNDGVCVVEFVDNIY